MNKVILLDSGALMFRAIFGYERLLLNQQASNSDSFIVPPHYTYVLMMLSALKKIGVTKDDIVIVALEGKSWRKTVCAEYKAQRKDVREAHALIDWDKQFSLFNKVNTQLSESTNWHFIREWNSEADDICVSKDTYIASPKIYSEKRIACKMKVNDPVYTYNEETGDVEIGYIKKVMTRKVYNQKRLIFHNNTSLEITENHPVLTTNNVWTKVKDLKIGDEIFHLSSTQDNKYVVKIPKTFLNSHDYYRLGYLLGSINGDGHFDYKRNRIAFNINDEDFVKRLMSYFDILFNYKTSFSKKDKTYRILIGNKLIFDYLVYMNSKNIKNKSFIKGYLAGFYDSEGNIYYSEGTWRLQVSNINKKRILKIKKYYEILGFKYKLTKRKQKPNDCYLLTSCEKNNINVLSLIRPAILRKYPNYNKHSHYLQNGLKIINIEEVKINPKRGHTVYNFEVEPNNNYFANNALVHNCAVACRYFKDYMKVIVSSDGDLKQLCYYPETYFFTVAKKCKGSNGVYDFIPDPLKIIADKTKKGDVSDNIIVRPDDTEEDCELRYQLVNLLKLPEYIETAISNEFDKIQPKKEHLDKLPFKNIKEKYLKIYDTDKIITPEYCLKLLEKRKAKKKEQARLKRLKEKSLTK